MLSFPEEMGMVPADRAVDLRAAAVPAHSWETELFIVCGTSRKELAGRICALQKFLQSNPDVCLKDLAYTLNADFSTDGSRLALVAARCRN
jgi:acyl transferase domain-containing protein